MPNKLPKTPPILKKDNYDLKMAYAALITANIIWGAAGSVIKITLDYVPVFTFLFLRFLIVCCIMLPFIILELKKNKIDKRDFINIILLGVFGQSSLFFVFEGLKYTTALDSAIIGVIVPILSIIAGHYFFNDKINKKIKVGVLLATIGTAIVVFEPVFGENVTNIEFGKRLYGNFLTLLYNLAFLLYIIWSKISLGQTTPKIKKALSFIHISPMKKEYSPLVLTTLTFFVALVTFIPLAFFEQTGMFGQIHLLQDDLPFKAIAGILFMAIMSSIVAYFAFEWGLTKASVSDTAILGYLSPIFALPFAYALLNETPSKAIIIGAIIIAVGVFVAEKGKR